MCLCIIDVAHIRGYNAGIRLTVHYYVMIWACGVREKVHNMAVLKTLYLYSHDLSLVTILYSNQSTL